MKTKHLTITLTVLLFIPIIAFSQWSDDANTNTVLSGTENSVYVPHIAVCSDGSSYISWHETVNSSIQMWMQHLDINGVELWQQYGIQVSTHSQYTWIADYSLDVDQNDNAIITFSDTREGTASPVIYKISPTGEFLWGPDGISLSSNASDEFYPQLCVLNDNSAIIAWARAVGDFQIVVLQRIRPDGTFAWPEEITIEKDDASVTAPDLLSVSGNQFLLEFSIQTGPFYAPDRHLYVSKYDENGAKVWANDAIITNQGGIAAWTDINIKSDGNDGMLIGWHDDRDQDMKANPWTQHVLSDGSLAFADNGIELSNNHNNQHFYVNAAGLLSSGNLMVFWEETDQDQNNRGLTAQLISPSGEKLWGPQGQNIIPLSPEFDFLENAVLCQDMAIVFYSNFDWGNVMDSRIYAFAMDEEQNQPWSQGHVVVSGKQGEKIHCAITDFHQGQSIISWEEKPDAGGYMIKAQNLNTDGSLGIVTSMPEQSNENLLKLSPNPAHNWLAIEHQGEGILYLYATDGRLVFSKKLKDKYIMDVSNMPSGIYHLEYIQDGNHSHEKLLLQ